MTEEKDTYLHKILDKIKRERNPDFSQYRPRILERRVTARVRIVKRDDFEQYFAYLKAHPEEMDCLMEAMTINVTEFFRDAYVFEAIEKKVIPEIFEKKRKLNSRSLRVWSCASSSEEEAYSILMLAAEFLGSKAALL